jgi:hypothetical protein
VADSMDQLGDMLATPEGRRSFSNDPMSAMTNAGIQADQIPEDLRDTLVSLTPQEWDAIDRVKDALTKAEVDPKIILKIV